MLNRESLLNIKDDEIVTVNVPEWNDDVCLRSMTGSDRDSFEQTIMKSGKMDMSNLRAKLLVMCICDSSGNLLLNGTDADSLSRKSAKALDRLFTVAQKMNGMSGEDIRELEKNSLTGLKEDSISD